MNDLQIFNNPQFGEVRTITENGVTLFCGKDVATALGYKRPNDAITAHCKGTVKRRIGVQTGTKADGSPATQQVEMLFIPEGDIYRLAARSELPGADAFERWIFDEVLPSIRKTGAYLTPAAEAQLRAEVQALAKREVQALAKRVDDLATVNDLLLDLDTRLLQVERRVDPPSGMMSIADIRPLASGNSTRTCFTPGIAARKRWMRTTSEKLDLMSTRFGTTHNEILHSLYQHLEKRCGVVLEEEKLKAMEEYNLVDCSVLTAIFYNSELRDAFEENIDYNLAPENRGW